MLPDAPRRCQMLPDAARCCQILPEAPTCSQMLPNAPKHLCMTLGTRATCIYTSAYPCIQCTEYARLRVECHKHAWSCPPVWFGSFSFGSVRSSAPARPSGLERPIRAPQRGRAGSECNRHPRPRPAKRLRVGLACPGRFVFVRLCLVEGAARPRGLERPSRTPQQDRGRQSKVEPSKS